MSMVFVLLNITKPILIMFEVVDLAAAIWTAFDLRST